MVQDWSERIPEAPSYRRDFGEHAERSAAARNMALPSNEVTEPAGLIVPWINHHGNLTVSELRRANTHLPALQTSPGRCLFACWLDFAFWPELLATSLEPPEPVFDAAPAASASSASSSAQSPQSAASSTQSSPAPGAQPHSRRAFEPEAQAPLAVEHRPKTLTPVLHTLHGPVPPTVIVLGLSPEPSPQQMELGSDSRPASPITPGSPAVRDAAAPSVAPTAAAEVEPPVPEAAPEPTAPPAQPRVEGAPAPEPAACTQPPDETVPKSAVPATEEAAVRAAPAASGAGVVIEATPPPVDPAAQDASQTPPRLVIAETPSSSQASTSASTPPEPQVRNSRASPPKRSSMTPPPKQPSSHLLSAVTQSASQGGATSVTPQASQARSPRASPAKQHPPPSQTTSGTGPATSTRSRTRQWSPSGSAAGNSPLLKKH